MNEVRLFHLGGGFGGSDEDSLFYFKSGFLIIDANIKFGK
jgi:hypothetical protein